MARTRIPDDVAARVASMLAASAEAESARVVDADRFAAIVRPHLVGAAEERLIVVAFNRALRAVGVATLTIGSDAFTIVDPRQILRWVMLQGRTTPSAFALAHNHPSGDPTPSEQDRAVTRRVATAGRTLGIRLLDHLVYVDSGPDGFRFRSLAADGDLPPYEEGQTWTA